MSTTYDDENLKRHSVSRDEVDDVLAGDPVDEDMEPSERGNLRAMFVGFSLQGRLLEVAVEYFPNEREHVFHALDATRTKRLLYERRKR